MELSIQRLKYLFLLTWTKLFIGERLMSILDFIDWFASVWGREYLFVFHSFFGAFWLPLYTLCVLWSALFGVFNTNLIYWSNILFFCPDLLIQAMPVVDGNVVRVIARLKAISSNSKHSATIKNIWWGFMILGAIFLMDNTYK